VILPLIGPTNEKTPIPLASKIMQDYSIGLWVAAGHAGKNIFYFPFILFYIIFYHFFIAGYFK
jgi:hypothetical protein